jgi:hypothetical protein
MLQFTLLRPRSAFFVLTVTFLACQARDLETSDGGGGGQTGGASGGLAGSSGLAGALAPHDGDAGVAGMTVVGGAAGQDNGGGASGGAGGMVNVWADGGVGMFDPKLPAAVLEACERARRSPSAPAPDQAAAGRALSGRFVLCTTRGMWNRPQAGLSIGADGRISLLEWTPDGTGLRPLTGMENEGAIDLTSFANTGQVNFAMDSSGFVPLHPLFGQSPHSFRFNSVDGPYAYVAADELSPPPAVAAARPVSGPLVGQAACAQPAGPRHRVATVAAARAALSRRWLFCGGVGLYTPGPVDGGPAGPPHAGLEITPDDHFYLLDFADDGQLYRRPGAWSENTIEYLPSEATSWGEAAHVTADFHWGRPYVTSDVVVSDAPVVFLLGVGDAGRYVAAE